MAQAQGGNVLNMAMGEKAPAPQAAPETPVTSLPGQSFAAGVVTPDAPPPVVTPETPVEENPAE